MSGSVGGIVVAVVVVVVSARNGGRGVECGWPKFCGTAAGPNPSALSSPNIICILYIITSE